MLKIWHIKKKGKKIRITRGGWRALLYTIHASETASWEFSVSPLKVVLNLGIMKGTHDWCWINRLVSRSWCSPEKTFLGPVAETGRQICYSSIIATVNFKRRHGGFHSVNSPSAWARENLVSWQRRGVHQSWTNTVQTETRCKGASTKNNSRILRPFPLWSGRGLVVSVAVSSLRSSPLHVSGMKHVSPTLQDVGNGFVGPHEYIYKHRST